MEQEKLAWHFQTAYLITHTVFILWILFTWYIHLCVCSPLLYCTHTHWPGPLCIYLDVLRSLEWWWRASINAIARLGGGGGGRRGATLHSKIFSVLCEGGGILIVGCRDSSWVSAVATFSTCMSNPLPLSRCTEGQVYGRPFSIDDAIGASS
jgi:hypothetical protein